MKNFRSFIYSSLIFIIPLLILGFHSKSANADVIDRIQINQAGDEAEIKIQFVSRVQFLRHVMLKNGDIRLYFNLLETDKIDSRFVRQQKESPPSKIVSHFTLTYPEIDSSLAISFGKVIDYHVRPGNDGRSISIFTPILQSLEPDKTLQTIPSAKVPFTSPAGQATSQVTSPKPKPVTPISRAEQELIELEAKQLMEHAVNVQGSGLTLASIAMLNKLLSLPPNNQSQTALRMRAQAYEKIGEFSKARADNLSYVNTYPKASDIKFMQESLQRTVMAAYHANKSVPEKMAVSEKMIIFGGFSQYYFKGLLQTNNTTLVDSVLTPSYISDQSQLLSTLDMTGMKTSATRETRLVFRDSFTANFLPGSGSSNFFDAAYFEQAPNDQSYYYGVGRKVGNSGGLPTRYDGIWLGSNLNEAWRVGTSVGQPSRFSGSMEEPKTFAGVGVNLSRQPGQWSGNTYLLGQKVANILDKRVAGIEAHYFDAKSNHTVLMEYDTLFKKVGIGMFQGNWITADDDNYTLLIEHRRSLQVSNALKLWEAPTMISDFLDAGTTTEDLMADALLATPIFNQFSVGMTHPYSPRVKFGGDLKFSATTSYETYDGLTLPTAIVPKESASTLTLQVVGNNLLFENDLGIASASYTDATSYQASSLSFSQVETFYKDLRLDMSLQLYESNIRVGDRSRINPNFRLNYQAGSKIHFEFVAGLVKAHTVNEIQDIKSRRKYFSLGYRWDL